ncbi:hypothetical protein M0804_013376 [Polistes exclamans]|nr:hypothetical protein M0804_013376 [Polistes exclamans]
MDCDDGVKTAAASSLMISVNGLAENPDFTASQYPTGCANYFIVSEINLVLESCYALNILPSVFFTEL